MASSRKPRIGYPFLPQIEDLLRLIEDWCRLTGVTKSQLAKLVDLDRSAMTHIFKGRQQLRYEEAQKILEHLVERLSPLPDEPVSSLATRPRDLVGVQSTDTVAHVARQLLKGNFTQVPVFEREKYLGLVTDRMIVERLLHPNRRFTGSWIATIRKMPANQADIIETSATYSVNATMSSVADALRHFYAVMLTENELPKTIVTRWDYLKLLAG